jgi:prepilin-type N-terminal cleavage/methylation domain-containing protein
MKRLRSRRAGFSLSELMIVVVVLGILSALVIDVGIRDWRRQQVNAVAVELAGWLDTVRRVALKGSSCTVTFEAAASFSPGHTLARSSCSPPQPFRISGLTHNQGFRAVVPESFSFTPAGTVHPAPAGNSPLPCGRSLLSRCLQIGSSPASPAAPRASPWWSCWWWRPWAWCCWPAPW